DLDVRILDEGNSSYNKMLIVHLYANTVDAMGANMINTMAEAIAPVVEHLTRGKVYLRILSNYADRCLSKATCVFPPELLASDGYTGEEVRNGVLHAYEFAARDATRAVTHNIGITTGIGPVNIETDTDWRKVAL